MNEPNADAIEGIVDFLILSTLSVGPMESFSIDQRVERKVGRLFQVPPGLVSAALQRMERQRFRVARQTDVIVSEVQMRWTGACRRDTPRKIGLPDIHAFQTPIAVLSPTGAGRQRSRIL